MTELSQMSSVINENHGAYSHICILPSKNIERDRAKLLFKKSLVHCTFSLWYVMLRQLS